MVKCAPVRSVYAGQDRLGPGRGARRHDPITGQPHAPTAPVC